MTSADVENMLEELATTYEKDLSPWELDFVESLARQWVERKSLTEKQEAKLKDVYDAAVDGP